MPAEEAHRESRGRLLLLVTALAYGVVVLALISTQVVRREHYISLARENRQMTTRIEAPRGVIADRNGVALADNVHQARLTIERRHAKEDDPSLETLISLLELERDFILDRVQNSREPDRVTVLRHADPEQIAVVEEHRAILPYVQLKVEPRRRYRFGSLGAHLIGYVGEVGADDLSEDPHRFYLSGDVIGKSGVESLAERQLRGVHGRRVVEVNITGHIVGEVPEGFVEATPGVKLFLTLSQPLQAKLEELLDGRRGAGVVLEVGTGDILALVSSPSFDPNEFTGGITRERYAELSDDPSHPLFNRALQGTYPPGSPYKLITAAAGLESGKATPRTRFTPCFGGYRLGNRVFRCWKLAGHGSLDLREAIAQSCDVYFYQLAETLTLEELAEAGESFGLGRVTGVELLGEAPGLVPNRAYYDRRFGPRGWTRGVMFNNAIGQGELLVTPLQMAYAYEAIAGDGHLHRPHLILARQNAFGVFVNRLVRPEPGTVSSESTLRFLRSALVDVVADESGTGGLARVSGITVAGKTGTAENAGGEDHAWFMAFAPAEEPELVVSLIVENAGHGGDVAAPIVGQLLETYFRWKSESASLPAGEERGR